jgi:hypothetical protein
VNRLERQIAHRRHVPTRLNSRRIERIHMSPSGTRIYVKARMAAAAPHVFVIGNEIA